ncbi:hypothetical protein GUJ93_ZPchr0008g12742 [Zizania palustris]|uniref:Uncharacterized protein n=1 Tax=Zizania palustris TaxID=103762 RepID=A0A8J5RAE9_ZIZPA|nr:hypothetical protein GUJ93_ZPchr0008g12742 [Zizania palustris]
MLGPPLFSTRKKREEKYCYKTKQLLTKKGNFVSVAKYSIFHLPPARAPSPQAGKILGLRLRANASATRALRPASQILHRARLPRAGRFLRSANRTRILVAASKVEVALRLFSSSGGF